LNDRWSEQSKHRDKYQLDNPNSRKCHLSGGSWSIPFDDLTDIPSRLFRDCTFYAFVHLYANRFINSARCNTKQAFLSFKSYNTIFSKVLTPYITLHLIHHSESTKRIVRLRKLTPKTPRTSTMYTSRITKRTRTRIPTSDSLPPSVTS